MTNVTVYVEDNPDPEDIRTVISKILQYNKTDLRV